MRWAEGCEGGVGGGLLGKGLAGQGALLGAGESGVEPVWRGWEGGCEDERCYREGRRFE
jgi:hypothetical protein